MQVFKFRRNDISIGQTVVDNEFRRSEINSLVPIEVVHIDGAQDKMIVFLL